MTLEQNKMQLSPHLQHVLVYIYIYKDRIHLSWKKWRQISDSKISNHCKF